MPFIPHTPADIAAMLASIGVPGTDALFDEIPGELNCGGLPGIPEGLSEMAITRLMHGRAAQDGFYSTFITETKLFNALAKEIKETLGPLTVEEDEKRPMAEGFAANLDYFKLEFLEPSAVAMGRQFEGILPILWMMAGARGPRPEPPENGCAHLHWLIPPANPFAVLMRETRFREFFAKIEGRDDLTHVFLVTNSDKAFHDMKADLPEHLTAVQLYKSYLDNFKINTQRV